jgi:hypothetical protein
MAEDIVESYMNTSEPPFVLMATISTALHIAYSCGVKNGLTEALTIFKQETSKVK